MTGTVTLDLPIADGQTTANFALQGLETATPLPSTVTITASAPGFTDGSGTATVVQPAMRLANLTATHTSLDTNDPFEVWIGVPTAGNSNVTLQKVRGGGTPLTATITNSNNTAARLVTSASTGQTATVQILPGQSGSPATVAAGGVEFDSLVAGSTVVSATIPGFFLTTTATVNVTITSPAITVTSDSIVGAGLQAECCSVTLGSANHGGVTVHLVSSDPTKILLAPRSSTVTGTVALDLPIADGQTTANFALQGLEAATPLPSTVTITASAPGFSDGSGTATVVQPAMRLANLTATHTTFNSNDAFEVWIGVPTAGNSNVTLQKVRGGGTPLTATITNSNNTAAQLVTSASTGQTATVQILPGQSGSPATVAAGGVEFDPLTAGSTAVSVTIPGFFLTTTATVNVTITSPAITVTTGTTVGAGLQAECCTVTLGSANHGGVTVHLVSSDPTKVLLTPRNSTVTGTATLDLPVADGHTTADFALQGLETAAGFTVTITASAPGFTDGSGTATVVQPAVRLNGLGATHTSLDTNDPFEVWVGVPANGNTNVTLQRVRGGGTLTATITNSNATAAQLVTAAVTGQTVTVQIPPGQYSSPSTVAAWGVEFDPLSTGTTSVQVSLPGFITVTSGTVTVTIAP